MSKPKRNERKVKILGISSKEATGKFDYALSEDFLSKKIEDKGQYVLTHHRIQLTDKNNIDVIIYTTDIIFISGSPTIPSGDFDRIATKIADIAQECTKSLVKVRPLTLQRAKTILDFASGLNLDSEYERMVVLILADTTNEIVLREKMKSMGIEGAPLEEGIPDKIKRLRDKGAIVYKGDEIKNIREIRNRIVHYGDVPDKSQSIDALKVAKEVLEKA
jgi:hypothetical protein